MRNVFVGIFMLIFSVIIAGCGEKKEVQYLQVKASTMIDDYIRDQGTAENKYKNQNIELTGNMISKGQFNNGNSFYVVVAEKYAAGRNYSIVVDYPTNRVEDVNKLKFNDFVVAKGVVIGVVPQKNPTDISVQLRIGEVSENKQENRPSHPVTTSNNSNVAPAATSVQNPGASANYYYRNLQGIEDRMKQFADRINSGEGKPPLIATGNVLRDDIYDLKRKVGDEPDVSLKNDVIRMHDLQIRRVDCMLRGLRGDTAAYSEGGGYYDEFYVKFNQFKGRYGI